MNIYDIAREAGVSIATVSRVINGSTKVKESTRVKVGEVLERHRYFPSVFARGMVSGSMSTIGVLTVDVRDIFFGTVTYTIEQAFSGSGYTTVLCNTGGHPEQQLNYLSMLTTKKVDGIILVGSSFDDQGIEKAVQEVARHIPVVMINRELQGDNIWSVICDEEQGVRECVAHIVSTGRREIHYIKDTNTYSAARKLSGFKLGMQDAGLPLRPESVIETEKGIEGGILAVEKLEKLQIPYSALVTGDDVTAAGVIKALHRAGRIPGREVAVSGVNDSIIALTTDPELTSVDNRAREMGSTAVTVLSQVLEGADPPSTTVLQPVLAIRASTSGPE